MTTTFIYLIHDPENKAYKIGFSGNPSARLKQLQTGNSRSELKLLYTFADDELVERVIHDALEDYKIQGEWFEECEAVLKVYLEFLVNSNQLDKLPLRFDSCYFKNTTKLQTPEIILTHSYQNPYRNYWHKVSHKGVSYLYVACMTDVLGMVMKSICREGWEFVHDREIPLHVKQEVDRLTREEEIERLL